MFNFSSVNLYLDNIFKINQCYSALDFTLGLGLTVSSCILPTDVDLKNFPIYNGFLYTIINLFTELFVCHAYPKKNQAFKWSTSTEDLWDSDISMG